MESDVKYNTTIVNKLPFNQKTDQFIIVESTWLSAEIVLNILEYKNTENMTPNEWHGSLLIDEIKSTCETLERPYNEFYAECRNALCQPNGLSNFIYTIDNGKFTWKKDLGGTKIIYGRVALTKSTVNLQLRFLLNSLDFCSELRVKLESKESEIMKLDIKHKEFIEQYEKYVTEKVQHDDKLLKQFLMLLNNKKAKIAELKQLLYEKNDAEDDSLMQTQSDVELDDHNADEEILVQNVPKITEANVQTQINDEVANDSSQSQELLGFTIPKRKQPTRGDIENAIKVRKEEETVADIQLDQIDSQVYKEDTQKMMDDL